MRKASLGLLLAVPVLVLAGTGCSSAPGTPTASNASAGSAQTGGGGGFQNNGRAVMGQVTAVNGNSLSVQLNDGSVKTVDAAKDAEVVRTIYATLADVKTGARVLASGSADADGTLTARSVRIEDVMLPPRTSGGAPPSGLAANGSAPQNGGRFRSGGPAVSGDVTAVSGTTIRVKAADGSARQIAVNDQTTYAKTESGSLGDIKVGAYVLATGTPGNDGTFTADRIQIQPAGQTGFGFGGFRDGGRGGQGGTAPSGQTAQ